MEDSNLGWVELHLGDPDAAETHFTAVGDPGDTDSYGKAWSAFSRAGLACARGQLDQARDSFDAGKRALREGGTTLDPDDQAEYNWLGARLALHCKFSSSR
jgi:hypothetical protein